METKNGTAFIIWIDTTTPVTALKGSNYRPVLCGTSNGFSMSRESISMRSKCDDGWDRTKSGYGSWGMTLSGHAISILATEAATKANFQQVGQLLIDKTEFWCKMTNLGQDVVREGVARISDYSEAADMEEPYSFDVTVVGIGKPIFEALPLPPPVGSQYIYFGTSATNDPLTLEEILEGTPVVYDADEGIVIPFNNPSYLFNWIALPAGIPIPNHFQNLEVPVDEGPLGSDEDLLGEAALIDDTYNLMMGSYEVPLTDELLLTTI